MTDLTPYLGKNISAICGNGFDDPDLNHCAHFASHAMGFDLGYTCKQHTGGRKPGAAIRVQELFAACPQVGVWPPPASLGAGGAEVLAFVTAKRNVDLATKTMQNVPKKHVGVYSGGRVFNYHNTEDKVGAEPPDEFHRRMKQSYRDPDLGFWWGTFPGTGLALADLQPTETGARLAAPAFSATAGFSAAAEAPAAAGVNTGAGGPLHFEVRSQTQAGRTSWFGTADDGSGNVPGPGPEFLVGKEVPYEGRRGLNRLDNGDPRYKAADYEAQYGPWAWLIEVTGECESGNRFATLNTYDTAAFTFGFFQMAAHTGADNLLGFMRDMLALPNAARYFPELRIVNGKLTKLDATGSTNLEATSGGLYTNLMAFLNPGSMMEKQEAVQGARFIHWALNDPALRDLQVANAHAKITHKITEEVDPAKLNLDGESDVIVCIVFDILHQGRAKYTAIRQAMAARNRRKALININAAYKPRAETLEAKISALEAKGKLGQKVYKRATREFV